MSYRDDLRESLAPLFEGYRNVALFDFPAYGNVGDHAIWLGTTTFLREVVAKPIVEVEHLRAEVLPTLSRDTVVLLQGGGNLGDLWPAHEEFRLRVIERYPNNRIIIMPQSAQFTSSEALLSSCKITRQHRDLYVCVRDEESVEVARQLTSTENVRLCPDMALVLLGQVKRPRQASIPFYALKRGDKEAADYGVLPGDVTSGDWIDAPRTRLSIVTAKVDRLFERYPNRVRVLSPLRVRLYEALAQEHFARGSALLAQGDVVLTDRLHAHLLCCLMGIPHVVMDNSYGKIGRFRSKWGTGTGICREANSWVEARELAAELAPL